MIKQQRLSLTYLFFFLTLAGCFPAIGGHAADVAARQPVTTEPVDYSQLIEQIKTNPRGPFSRIRWFCNDGSILAPRPYACRDHGGGVQHGEWNDTVKQLRQQNYLIATLLADLDPESFFKHVDWRDQLKQILLERFMMEVDSGWIFRQARYYRGAIQDEAENGHGRSLLLGLLSQPLNLERDFILLREAVRFIPHGQNSDDLSEMRELSQVIAADDKGFSRLRNKLHNHPEAADALEVKSYAESVIKEKRPRYLHLAELVVAVTRPPDDLFSTLGMFNLVRRHEISRAQDNEKDLTFISQMLLQIRTRMDTDSVNRKLQLLDLSLQLEAEFYRRLNMLLASPEQRSRIQQFELISAGVDALFGTGMLSTRERLSLKTALDILQTAPLTVVDYQREVAQLARTTRWAENRLRYHFGAVVTWLAVLDRSFNDFIPERLRGSPLLPLSRLIDSLQNDSQQLVGVTQKLFGRDVVGMNALNPGMARGRFEIVNDPLAHSYSADGIYLLPETLENLPPVAGILTRGEGNTLSHIQLLARNLGIPNIAVSAERAADLRKHDGQILVLSASQKGDVQVEADSSEWQQRFSKQKRRQILIEPDLDKLDLEQRQVLPLDQIKATDSGRIAGPKGANLGELRQVYPDLVPDALIIPFGRFYHLLLQTSVEDGVSLFQWMKKNYQALKTMEDGAEKERQTAEFLKQLRVYIRTAPLPVSFVQELKAALEKRFGLDGSFGVFVRSDTNVEDLPGFTGAGLNKTVPHVVGFDNILDAIRKVWASPFSLRAYSWRQAHMRQPEHVYASVLLMISVPAEKSGVLVTTDLSGGDQQQLHVAVNEGIGGAVSGQRAEEILISKQSGKVRLLSQSSAAQKRILLPQGGIKKVAAEAPQSLLTIDETDQLKQMAAQLPPRFASLRDRSGALKPADIEFGFRDGRFVLFQIRPLVENKRLKKDLYLARLNEVAADVSAQVVDLDQPPRRSGP